MNHNEESRAHVLSGGIKNELAGMHAKFSSWLGSLHPSLPTCRQCPQYGQKLVYARKCYYQRMCPYPAFIGIRIVKLKLKFKEAEAQAKIARSYRILGWEM